MSPRGPQRGAFLAELAELRGRRVVGLRDRQQERAARRPFFQRVTFVTRKLHSRTGRLNP
jgi:hypothetical protein